MKPAFTVLGALLLIGSVNAQSLSGPALVNALRKGGYVIVMRHASSPREAPDRQTAEPGNVRLERQLDQTGRDSATAMGNALRELKIPIGQVLSSPTFRALETVRLAQLGNPQTFAELGDGGQSMQGATAAQTAWLRKQAAEFPAGANTVIVTHLPNIAGAFPQWSTGLTDGEALILGPDGKGGDTLVARVNIEEWPRMPR